MLHIERQGIAPQPVTDIVQLLLDLENGYGAGRFGLKGATDARPPPSLKLLTRKCRLAARRDHAQPLFDLYAKIGDHGHPIKHLDGAQQRSSNSGAEFGERRNSLF